MRLVSALPLVALAAVTLAAPAASAEPICTGTAEDAKVCVDPAGTPGASLEGSLFSRCLFVPTIPECTTVSVPGVRITSGDVPLVTCEGPQCPPQGDPVPDTGPLPGGGGCGDPTQRGPVIPRIVVCIQEGHL
ncbi:MAG TPA: hypothetical protein VGX28_15460 [Frankiaceae bacterium]|jgi:hypothetical protein|nr:hypothetical protein [Frankiaceae bacterium]